MKKHKPIISALGASALVAIATPAHAAITSFFGEDLSPGGTIPAGGNAETARNSFLSSLVGVGTEDFESQSTGSIGSGLALSFPGSSGAITATLTGGGGTIYNSPGAGRFATSGTQYLESDGGSSFNIAFSSPISAFGFFGTDIGDFGGQAILTLSNGGSEMVNIGNTAGANNGSLLYFGFLDNANSYTNIAFANTSGSDFFGFDDMTVGDLEQIKTVPDGGTSAMLLGLALGAIGFVKRRTKR